MPSFSRHCSSRRQVRPASLRRPHVPPSRGPDARATARRSWIGRCRMFTVDTLTFHPPSTPPDVFHPSSPSFTVHYSRQSMSRGGKLAPEVNRYVRPSPHRVPRQGKAMTASSHDPCANMTFLQSSLREEPEVSCTSAFRRPCRLTGPQLQRYPRGTL